MKISVVVPAYNEEKYLPHCLHSLKKQDHQPDEIIVVNNNSTDKTEEIAKAFNVTVKREKKQGMIFARNTGFNASTGDVIARCDADTLLPSDWIKKIHTIYQSSVVDALSGPIVFYEYGPQTSFFSLMYVFVTRTVRLNKPILLGPNMAIRKTAWEEIKNSVCLDDKQVHEDIDLAIHLEKKGKHIVFDQSLVVKISGRRLKTNPFSFFVEYPIRVLKTIKADHHV